MPYNADNVLVIDPENTTISYISVSSGSGKYAGGVLAPNGKIYAIPLNAENVLIIDPENTTTTISYISVSSGSNQYIGGVLAPNGKIYAIPFNADNVLQIKTGLPIYPSWMLEAYFNKF
jgi:hypothetical protein